VVARAALVLLKNNRIFMNMGGDRQLIQVVPRMTPVRCGVSDVALLLAAELKAAFGIETAIAVVNSQERCELELPVAYCAPAELLDACLSLSGEGPGDLLVHLSGYGYSADGAPTLVADALERVKTDGHFRIAVFFHELYASGPPWTSAFWYARRQKRAYRRIAEVCDLAVTSARVFADWLERQTASAIECMPVFSHVGEARSRLPFAERDRTMVVFGLGGTRQRVYRELAMPGDALERLGVEEILDIGFDCNAPRAVNGIRVRSMGVLAAAEIDRLLTRAAFGYLAYPPNCLAKSGVFAAYSAHGVVPMIAESFRGEFDGLRDGEHALSREAAKGMKPEALERCSIAAWQWYAGHSLHHHAALYDRWLNKAGAAGRKTVRGAGQDNE
jgi:hypothetical protein